MEINYETIIKFLANTKKKEEKITSQKNIYTYLKTIPSKFQDLFCDKTYKYGITIYDNYPAVFYNAYLPYMYYNPATWTGQDDNSLLFVNFCLFPGMYQPSGHLNISRARETYINIVSSYVSTNARANFIVVASAINFLLISDGSAVLRYST